MNLKIFCLSMTFLGMGCAEVRSGDASDAPLLEFRVGYRSPEPGLVPMEYEGSQIYLTPWVVLDDSSIESLTLERGAPEVILNVSLYTRASERLREITGRNVGEELAVLVRGEIRALATIRSPLGGGRLPLQVRLNMDRQEADRFARDRVPIRRREYEDTMAVLDRRSHSCLGHSPVRVDRPVWTGRR